MKGRKVPPPPPRIPQSELPAFFAGRIGLHMLRYYHDDDCPARHTQRIEDCTCTPDVSLWRYESEQSWVKLCEVTP